MKKGLLYLMLTFMISYSGISQSFTWGKNFGGIGDDVVRNMVVDDQGNSYITGYFSHTLVFGEGTNQVSLPTNGVSDIFVAKVNAAGDAVWVKKFGGADNDYANSIARDVNGNIYITGAFQLTVNFNPGGQNGLLTSKGAHDNFILKLDPNGNFTWVKSFGSIGYEETISVDVDPAGNIYLAGYFFMDTDFDPSDNEYFMNVAPNTSSGYFMKLDTQGNFVWAKQITGSYLSYCKFIKVAKNGDLYVLGEFVGSTDLNPANDEEFIVESPGKDIFILHLDPSGNFINANRSASIDTSGNTEVWRLDFDSIGNVYVIGSTYGNINFNPSDTGNNEFTIISDTFYTGFILKINTVGTPQWLKAAKGNDLTFVYDISVSDDDFIYIAGYFRGVGKFGPITINQQSSNYWDAYVARMDKDGKFQYVLPFGGSGGPDGHEIETGPGNSLYLSSSFHRTVDLNPLEGELLVSVEPTIGYRDIYIIKLGSDIMGVPEKNNASNLFIYPNVAENYIQIGGKENVSNKNYQIFDMTGKRILSGIVDFQQKIILENLAAGAYHLIIDNEFTFKLIKN